MIKSEWDKQIEEDKVIWDGLKEMLFQNWKGSTERFEEIIQKMFDIAFKEGQQFVWFARSGFRSSEDELQNQNITITSSEPEKTFIYKDGVLVEEKDN
jgi:hypothetical protein